MPVHRIRLKYPDRCVRCGAVVESGVWAMWDSETSRVWCAECPPRPTVSADQDRWERLVRYLRRCVEAEAACAVLPLGSNRLAALPLGEETVFARGARQVPLLPELDRLAGRLQSGQTLHYGWPTVVLGDCLAPLFSVELGRPSQLGGALPLQEDPALNHGLVRDEHFDAAAVAAVRTLSGSRLPVGDGEGMLHLVDAIARLLGLPGLGRSVQRPDLPRAAGLHNVAVAVIAEGNRASRALLEELDALEGRTDWTVTAAARLLDPAPSPEIARDRGPAAPLPLNRVQEDAVRAMRQRGLTVVSAPPGTGKTHLAVAALANAWLDGESALVASTDPAAVEAAAARARAVHPGLVLRTGNSSVREGLPARVRALAGAEPTDEVFARRELAQALQRRAGARSAVERRSALQVELLAAVRAEEEAARRAWGGPPPPEVDPALLLGQAERLAAAWLFGGLRRRRFLRAMRCAESAQVEDLAGWARATMRFREAAAELEPGDDGALLQASDAEWVRASHAATVAAVSAQLAGNPHAVEALARARHAGPGLAQAVQAALPTVRGWACTALSAKQNFPLQPGFFDLVVVDEANQCTLAALLPLAYRARRLAVLGDPGQLRPAVTLDDIRLESLAASCGFHRPALEQEGLDHGQGSAFAACAQRAEVLLLDEHYRCHPAIARWLNEGFYGGALTVLTDVGAFPPGRRGLSWVDVEGEAKPGPAGGLVNEAEADALLDFLAGQVDSGSSLGVVTPFAAQAALIRRRADQRFPRAVDLLCGTPASFQGEERDVVACSAVLAPGASPRTARWVEAQRHLLGVAAGRARRALVVFGHPAPGIPTLESLRAAAQPVEPGPGAGTEAERRLAEALRARGLSPAWKPVVEGYELGLVLPGLDVEVDEVGEIDVQGRHRARAVARDRVLGGLGYPVLRLPAWRCLREPDAVADEVVNRLASGPTGRTSAASPGSPPAR